MSDPIQLPDRFELVRPLGAGGMSDVVLVRDQAGGELRALKRLRLWGPEAEELIRNEFARLARIHHDNIVRVFDYGILPDGNPYFTMEFLEGQSLHEAVRPGDITGALRAMRGVLAGLEALHAAGLVHCDVHGSNIRVLPGPDGTLGAKLLDLGLAGRLSDEAGERVRGRPGYVAPEVLAGAKYSRESDYFALGATLYRVLTGRPAFPGRDPAEILALQRRGAVAVLPLRASQVPARLETVLLQLLSANPEHRRSAALELAELASRKAVGQVREVDVLRGFGPLIGRDAALADLRRELLESSRPTAAVLFGPFGSGRTRLAREVAIEAELAGWDVAWFDGITSSGLPGGSSGRRSLVVADDIETWSERAVEELTRVLLESGSAVLFIQSRPAIEGDALYRALLSLPEPPAPRSLQLGPLEGDQVAKFATQRLGGEVPEEIAQLVAARVGTLPGPLLRELDRWISRGWLIREGDHWRATDATTTEAETPDPADDADRALLSRLEPAARITAFVVACWPPADPADRLADAAGLDRSDFAARLNDLEWGGVLQRDGDVRRIWPTPLAFALMTDRSMPELAGLRARLLDALVTRTSELRAGPAPTTAGTLAWCSFAIACHEAALGLGEPSHQHLFECLNSTETLDGILADEASTRFLESCAPGNAEHASQVARLAGRWAQEGNTIRAERAWQVARELIRGSDRELEVEWAFQHARLLGGMYKFGSGIEVLDSVLGHETSVGSPSPQPGRLVSLRAWYDVRMGNREIGLSDLRAAVRLLGAGEDSDRAVALMRLGITLYLAGDREEGAPLLDEALELAVKVKNPEIEARVRSNQSLRYRIEGDLDRADAESRRGLACIQGSGKTYQHFVLVNNLLNTAYDRRDWPTCTEAQSALESISRQSGNLSALSRSLNSKAIVAILRGSVPVLVSALRRERTWLRSSEHLEQRAFWTAHAGMALAWLGEERRGLRRLRRCIAYSRSGSLASSEALAARAIAEMALVQGRLDSARRWFLRSIKLRGGDLSILIPACLGLGRVALQTGESTEIAAATARLRPFIGSGAPPDLRLAIAELEAYELLLAGEVVEAKRTHTMAISGLRALDLAPVEILAAWQFGRALLAIDPPGAIEAMNRAHELAQQRGIRGWSRRIADEVIAMKPQPIPSRDMGAPHGEFLARAIELLNSLSEFPILLQRSLALAANTAGADRGFILLNDDTFSELRVVASFGAVDEGARDNAKKVSRTIVRCVTRTGVPFLTDDVEGDPRLGSTQSLLDMAVRSLLCVPLRMRDRVIGTIYLESSAHAAQFSEADLDLLESFANLVAVAIENGRLQDELRRSRERVITENLSLRRDVSRRFARPNIIGQSARMEQILDEVERVAMSKLSVLITGETGTGKELIAKSIHYASPRADQPFIPVNCAAITGDLMESELFGIVSGAASNVTEHRGVFERAHGGTLFLDEIGDMPLQLQIKVLRVLEEREFTPVRGSRVVKADFRLVSATNKDLRELVRQKAFRDDLYFRVNGHEIWLPPLRERRADIPPLADHFLRRFCEDNGYPLPRISPEFTSVIMGHSWEGNIRDLRNYVERCAVLSRGSVLKAVIQPTDLGVDAGPNSRPAHPVDRGPGAPVSEPPRELRSELRGHERAMIVEALERSGWNQRRAASELQLSEATLRNRMARLQISPPTGFTPRRGRPRNTRG